MEKEIVKVFKRFRDTPYYSDDCGNIISSRTGRALRWQTNYTGHKVVHMDKTRAVHRVVFELFGNPWPLPPGLQVNHKDDNKSNNNITNLYAGTQKQNSADAIRNGTARAWFTPGNSKHLTVKDKKTGEEYSFFPAKKFFKHERRERSHRGVNVGEAIQRFKWIKEKYDIISFGTGKDTSCITDRSGRVISRMAKE